MTDSKSSSEVMARPTVAADSPGETQSRAHQLAERLRRAMIEGDIRPGSKLASERSLCRQFDASRSTVREAIGELQGSGLVQTQHGGGSRCMNLLEPFFQDDPDAATEPSLSLQQQVLEMREMLEGEAAYYCAVRASDDELAALAQEYARMGKSEAGANTLRQAKVDLGFHMRIAEHSHHLLVMSLSQVLYTRYFNAIHGVLSLTFKKQGRYPEHIGAQHRQIFSAIMARDAEASRRAARDHIAYTRGLLLS